MANTKKKTKKQEVKYVAPGIDYENTVLRDEIEKILAAIHSVLPLSANAFQNRVNERLGVPIDYTKWTIVDEVSYV